MKYDSFRVVSVFVCLGVLVLYNVIFYSGALLCGAPVQLNRNLENYYAWLTKHQGKDDAPNVTLAIQTLRNTILVAVFVGGSSFQYGLALLNAVTGISKLDIRIRAIISSCCLFGSFLCWAGVIRYAAHLGYEISVLAEKHKKYLTIENERKNAIKADVESNEQDELETQAFILKDDVDQKFEEGHRMLHGMLFRFSLGFRFLFLAIPFFFYSAGPIATIISTAVIVLFLISIDYENYYFKRTTNLHSTK